MMMMMMITSVRMTTIFVTIEHISFRDSLYNLAVYIALQNVSAQEPEKDTRFIRTNTVLPWN